MKRSTVRSSLLALIPMCSLVACRTAPDEPIKKDDSAKSALAQTAPRVQAARIGGGDGGGPPVHVSPDDPLKGEFSLAEATKDMKGKGPLVATIETS